MSPFRSRSFKHIRRPVRLVGAVVAVAALVGALPAASVGAQEPVPSACVGVSVSATVTAPSVPSGSWSTVDTCVPPEAVYEAEVLGYELVGGLGVAASTDGRIGRIAFVTAKVAGDRALMLVGVEDSSTGGVTWAYADGRFSQVGTQRTVGGAANAATVPLDAPPGPVEAGDVQLTIDGTGTDLSSAEGVVADQIRAFLDQAVVALTS
jgi:hypothetical protein